MKNLLLSTRDLFVSLKLTIALLLLGIVLVFAATIDQVNLGIWAVQQKYFHAFVVFMPIGRWAIPVFPGGYLLGGLLLMNLLAAHVYRFAFTWRKLGIQLAHGGLILLLIGELLSGLWQSDHHMRINEGETARYAESSRDNELVLIDVTNPDFDDVFAISEDRLAQKAPIQHPKLPFRVVTKTYYPNSMLQARTSDAPDSVMPMARATAGFGTRIWAAPQPVTYRPSEANAPTAFVEIAGAESSPGIFLVSTLLAMPQEFTYAGRSWQIALRAQRRYFPFTLSLLKFSHDRYAGTEIPKNFASRLRLRTDGGRDDRDVVISMNNPLRYAGLAIYQAGFENNDRTTILQVVRNPTWVLPYVSCALMTLGLTFQFGVHLFAFVGRRARPVTRTASATSKSDRRSASAGADQPLPATRRKTVHP
jgi:hypothetical protein